MNRSAYFFDLGGTLLALDDNNEIAYDRHGRATILPGVGERLATQRLCATAGMGRFIWAADYFGWPKP